MVRPHLMNRGSLFLPLSRCSAPGEQYSSLSSELLQRIQISGCKLLPPLRLEMFAGCDGTGRRTPCGWKLQQLSSPRSNVPYRRGIQTSATTAAKTADTSLNTSPRMAFIVVLLSLTSSAAPRRRPILAAISSSLAGGKRFSYEKALSGRLYGRKARTTISIY